MNGLEILTKRDHLPEISHIEIYTNASSVQENFFFEISRFSLQHESYNFVVNFKILTFIFDAEQFLEKKKKKKEAIKNSEVCRTDLLRMAPVQV